MRLHGNRRRTLLLLAVVTLVLTACEEGGLVGGVTGSGNLVTEVRDVAGTFTGIEASGAVNVDITVGAGESHTVNVTYDDNILDKVVTRVSGGTLILELEGSLNLTGDAGRIVAVTMPELTALDASGASDVHVVGSTTSYTLDASGASNVDVRDLEAVDIQIDVSGASDVDLFATGTVSGDVSGASDVKVFGKPVSALIDSSGASTVDIVD